MANYGKNTKTYVQQQQKAVQAQRQQVVRKAAAARHSAQVQKVLNRVASGQQKSYADTQKAPTQGVSIAPIPAAPKQAAKAKAIPNAPKGKVKTKGVDLGGARNSATEFGQQRTAGFGPKSKPGTSQQATAPSRNKVSTPPINEQPRAIAGAPTPTPATTSTIAQVGFQGTKPFQYQKPGWGSFKSFAGRRKRQEY